MLGLGDVVMPGLLLCFVMRYDAYKRAQVNIVIVLLVVVSIAIHGVNDNDRLHIWLKVESHLKKNKIMLCHAL